MSPKLSFVGKSDLQVAGKPFPKTLRDQLGSFLYQTVMFSISAREELEENLDYYDALDEMEAEPREWPWPGASSFIVPYIPAQLNSLTAKLTSLIFVERFFLVNGNTAEASANQYSVERYYNAELSKHSWVHAFYNCTRFALRDGTSIMEVMWKKDTSKKRFLIDLPKMDEMGNTLTDDEGNPEIEHTYQEIEIENYNDVELTSVEVRDFLLLPSWKPSIENDGGVARAKLYSEQDLLSMVKSKKNPTGWLWKEEVQTILATRSPGESDLNESLQSIADYKIRQQIEITEDTGNTIDGISRQRGPFKCWLIFSNALDMDGDGQFEENVFLLHEESQTCAGTMPYPYLHGRRPYIALAPLPRPNRFFGKSICELLKGVQEGLNTVVNQKNDEATIRLSPPRYVRRGAMVQSSDERWGPDVTYEVDDPSDVGIIPLPGIPTD
ncbi:MAG: portal protein, partial [Candidatus Dormibacteria bacterium]